MNAKYLVLGAVIGGFVLFLWGAVTHAVLPQPLHWFKDEQAVIQVLRANAPENGVYLGPHGMFAALAFLPDYGDRTKNIAPNLIWQYISDTLAALLLAIFLLQLPGSVLGRACWAALGGVVAFVLKIVPYWNWYGFSPSFIGMEALDLIGKFFIGGLVLGALAKKFAPKAGAAA